MLKSLRDISVVPPGQAEDVVEEDKTPRESPQPAAVPSHGLTLLVESDPVLGPNSGSSASIASSFASSAVSSTKSVETEEDEGMILIGRPS